MKAREGWAARGRWRGITLRAPIARVGCLLAVAMLAIAGGVHAQTPPGIALADLLHRLETENPELHRAEALREAARDRVDPAGALPDPMVTAGLMNLPAWSLDLGMEGMSMAVLELGQRFPAPGVREARVRSAKAGVEQASHRRDALALELRVQVAEGYAELLYLDESLAVLERTRALLRELAEIAGVRLGEGYGAQADVVRTHTELARIEERVSDLRGERTRAEAALSALLEGSLPPGFQVDRPHAWGRLLALQATPDDFAAVVPDRLPGLGLPPVSELLEQALARHPRIAAAQAGFASQEAERLLAERERRPDIEVMLGYGMRSGNGNMWSASVSVPVPLFRGRKQDPLVRAAAGEAEAARSEVRKERSDLEARITAAWSDLARARERFHLVERLVLPQATTTVESAMSAFRAGSEGVSFLSVLESLTTLLASETERARSARDLAVASARLDGAAGTAFFLDPES
jgi:outer membrane protein, heavy metal efflux system